jgi:hypothetical protein
MLQVEAAGAASVQAAQARGLLVLAGRLSFRELEECRILVTACPDALSADAVAVICCQAAQQAPQSTQVQTLLETLRTAEVRRSLAGLSAFNALA